MPCLRFWIEPQFSADAGGVLQAEFRAFLHVVEDLGVEQQRLGRNAADVQAGAAQVRVFFDKRGLQAELAGANGRGVSGRSAADDGYVVDGLWQVLAPILWRYENGKSRPTK